VDVDDHRAVGVEGLVQRLAKGTDVVAVDDAHVGEVELLEHCLREDLNKRAPRFMGVLDPVKVVLTNWPADKVEMLDAVNNPEDASQGTRAVPFSGTLYIDREDFREVPPPKYHRLSPGQEVRLRWAYVVRCTDVVKDASGAVAELHCTVDPATRGGETPGRKVKGTIHWVSAAESLPAEVRLYDRLFAVPNPDDAPQGKDFLANLSRESLVVRSGARVEPALSALSVGPAGEGDVQAEEDEADRQRILTTLKSQQDSLKKVGLSIPELDRYFSGGAIETDGEFQIATPEDPIIRPSP